MRYRLSDFARPLIRREQERNAELDAIRLALIDGENSGEARPFSADEFKQRMLRVRG